MHCLQDMPQVKQHRTIHMNKDGICLLPLVTGTQSETGMYCVGVCC
jgi:hypothetical protein